MKFQATLIFALASIVEIVATDEPGMSMSKSKKPGDSETDKDWDFAPSCARSCLSSAYPTISAGWTIPCAATPTSLSNCINSACSVTATTAASVSSALSSVSSMRSSLCSIYLSCRSASQSCTFSRPFFGPGPGPAGGPFPPLGWQGPGPNGFYTYTCTDGRNSGFSTTTFTVTSTSSGPSGTSILSSEVTETATLVAAAAAGGSGTRTSSAAKSTVTGNGAVRQEVLGLGALLAVGAGVVVLL